MACACPENNIAAASARSGVGSLRLRMSSFDSIVIRARESRGVTNWLRFASRTASGTPRRLHKIEGSYRYGRASSTRLSGVWVARRTREKLAASRTLRRRASPAWAPSASPTSCDLEHGVHSIVDAA